MQLEDRAAEWLAGELQRGEAVAAVAAGSYPSLTRGKPVWIAGIAAAVVGVGLEAFAGVPSPFGLVGAFFVAIAIWYGRLLRRPSAPGQPGAPWPLVVATNRRVLFIKRALVGEGGSIEMDRKRGELRKFDVTLHIRSTYRTTLHFADGPDIEIELHKAERLVDLLG